MHASWILPRVILVLFNNVQLSFDISEYTANVDGVGTLRLLDAIRTCKIENQVKFYQVCPYVCVCVCVCVCLCVCVCVCVHIFQILSLVLFTTVEMSN